MLRGVLGKYGPFGKGAVVYLEESESHKRGPESAPLEVDGPGRLSSGQLEAKNKEEARTGGHKARPGQIADGKATSEGGDALLTRPLKVETKESVAVLSQVGDGEARPQGVKSPIASPREVEEGTEALAKGIPPRLYSAKPAEPDHRSSLGSDRVPEYTASDDKDSSR